MDLMCGSSLLSQLNNLLSDLEVTYLDLVGGNKWDGITAKPSTSSFFNKIDDADDEDTARALAAKSNIPWEEWVKKFAKCHHCGKQGHIHPNCPDYLKKVASGEITQVKHPRYPQRRSPRENRNDPPRRHDKNGTNDPPRHHDKNFLKNPKAKAFLSAFQALFCEDSGNDEDADEVTKDNEDDHKDGNNDLHTFLSMVGSSLKE
jgi:hypothetical protein